MIPDTQRLSYRVSAAGAAEAAVLAKDLCRAEGWTIRTVARIEASSYSDGQWVVTIAARPKAPTR